MGMSLLVATPADASPLPKPDEPYGTSVIFDHLVPEVPSVSTSQALSKRAKQIRKRKIKKILKMPKVKKVCSKQTCVTYAWMPRVRCQIRIQRKVKRVCKPWKRVKQSVGPNPTYVPPVDEDDEPDEPWRDPNDASIPPKPTAEAVYYRPGINAIPDLGIPTGDPTDYVVMGPRQNWSNRCNTGRTLYLRINYGTVPPERMDAARALTARALQHIADQYRFSLVVQGEFFHTVSNSELGNVKDDTDIWLSFKEYPADSSQLGQGGGSYGSFGWMGGYVHVRSNFSEPSYNTVDEYWNSTNNGGAYATLLHEFGHALGLRHATNTNDPNVIQIMSPSAWPMVYGQFQAGDRAGLHAVGVGLCI